MGNLCVSVLYGFCNLPLPSFQFNRTRLKDLSACSEPRFYSFSGTDELKLPSVQQIDVRLEQAIFLPQQFHVLQRRGDNSNAAYLSAHYISFYNCIWLVLNDTIVGAAFGTFLLENSTLLGHLLHEYANWLTVTLVRNALVWLDHWPAGLKLNTELSRFLCLCFMSLTDIWGSGLDLFAPHFPAILSVLGITGRFGMTMILSLLSDLLSILTGHLYLSYLIATVIFSRQLSIAHSLWNLFRGKRHNVLRDRTDSWDYDIDQLLLGTILFTLVAFLLPTVLVYYALFALARVVIILLHASLETVLAFMNHFPLFAMMLRAKDPSRLPGGVYLDVTGPGVGKVVLRNLPISISRIFFQHLLVWSRLSAHYHPLRLLRCLVTGTPLTQISRYSIRYSMVRKMPTNESSKL
ncbi:N-acetylglucosaminyl transferase component-domain-containing protein [Gautieria morchelliformis]|nr:N-acetylglucosaminyl transferase component-domain-containing protein [Gautieria morchelliformis]